MPAGRWRMIDNVGGTQGGRARSLASKAALLSFFVRGVLLVVHAVRDHGLKSCLPGIAAPDTTAVVILVVSDFCRCFRDPSLCYRRATLASRSLRLVAETEYADADGLIAW